MGAVDTVRAGACACSSPRLALHYMEGWILRSVLKYIGHGIWGLLVGDTATARLGTVELIFLTLGSES
jgi:hypothetical protein